MLHRRHLPRPAVVQRFLEEARIGARMEHPGIASVHEVGVTADGRPYFAMRLVQGSTLAARLAAHPTEERRAELLHAFTRVCETMAYAHARGVVHRDLKPANVMVGAFGEVLVLDWGLARCADATAEADGARGARVVVGTRGYMAPEQERGESEQVDARADVFALGAILREILSCGAAAAPAPTGELGFDARLAELAERCHSPAPQDRPRDAEAIAEAMHAHELDREAAMRAATVAAAAAQGRAEAALAKARAERRARRVVAILLLVIVGGGLLAYRALHRERDRVTRQADVARQVAAFLGGMFESDASARFGAEARTARQFAMDAYRRLRQSRGIEPEARAGIAHALGEVLLDLGEFDRAKELLEESLTVLSSAQDPESLEVAAVHEAMGRLLLASGAVGAVDRFRAAIRILRGRRDTPEVDLRRVELGEVRALSQLVDTTAFLQLVDEYLGHVPADRAELLPLRVEALLLRGERLALNTRIVAARPWLDEAWTLAARLGADQPVRRRIMETHARFRGLAGDHAGSVIEIEQCLERFGELYGPEHPSVLALRYDLMEQLWKAGRTEEAAQEGDRLIPVLCAHVDPLSQLASDALLVLGKVYIDLGRGRDAVPLMEDVQRRTAARLAALDAPSPTNTGNALRDLSRACAAAGDLGRAEQLLRQALLVYPRHSEETARHCLAGVAAADLAEVLHRQGRDPEAERTAAEAVQHLWWAVGVWPDQYLRAVRFLADRLAARGGPALAGAMIERELARLGARRAELSAERDRQPWGACHYALCVRILGGLQAAAGQRAEARASLEEAVALLDDVVGPDYSWTRAARADLAAVR